MQHRSSVDIKALECDFKILKYGRRKTLHAFVILCMFVIFSFMTLKVLVLLNVDGEENYSDVSLKSSPIGEFDKDAPILIMSVCQGKEKGKKLKKLSNSINRQIEQLTTLIKSAAVLSTSFVNFIIVVDKDSHYDKIIQKVLTWPEEVVQKLSFQMREAWFPEGTVFRDLFRACACARLFFPEQMTDIDSAIYLDTDMLFMKPPEDLWSEFKKFDSKQMSGLAYLDLYYNTSLKIPYYGNTGLNSGLWMMNMTRMRKFPGGWRNEIQSTFKEYREYMVLPDQDVANIIFNKTPQYLHPMGCNWNFRSLNCVDGKNLCEDSKLTGAYILHGNALKFLDDDDLKMKTMYEVWRDFQPGRPLTELLDTFKTSLKRVDGMAPSKYCSRVEGIDRILIKGLEDHIRNYFD